MYCLPAFKFEIYMQSPVGRAQRDWAHVCHVRKQIYLRVKPDMKFSAMAKQEKIECRQFFLILK
jgi:hypothetical protein